MNIKESDRYMTPSWVIDAVTEQFGVIDLDPCHDPDEACVVRATTTIDVRRGEDGLVLPWSGKVFCNPPYSAVLPWVIRAAQHAAAGGEVVMLINASTDTAAWQSYVLPHGEVCLLSKRVAFFKPGATKATPNLQPSALVYFGSSTAGRDTFRRVWSRHGTIVRRVDVLPAAA